MSKQTWTGWYQALINHMQQMDVNVQAIQSQAGIKTTNPELLQITQDDMTHLWNAALDACGDKALGLKVGQNLRPNAIGTVSWAMMSSNTVGDAIDVLMQHQHLLADALDFSLIKHEKHVEVVLNNIGDKIPASPLSIDASVMAFLTYLRWLTRDTIQFSAVHFNRSKVSSLTLYQQYLGCRLRLEQPQNSVWITSSDLAIPLGTADPDMAKRHMQSLESLAKTKLQGDFQKMVVKLIRQYLGQASLSAEFVAEKLHISKSTLQRLLKSENTHFQKLLDQTRTDMAISLLRHSKLPVVQIADRLGFASANSFCRGFKRFTGCSPTDYRKGEGDSH